MTQTQCNDLCPPSSTSPVIGPFGCQVYDDSTGGHLTCIYCLGGTGRRPEGLSNESVTGPDAAARFLAQTAYLEAASVHAFERLSDELEAHGAPARLAAASRRAAIDEIRHARVTGSLARRAGARVPEVKVEPLTMRSLEEIALENAVEGCVRETFGAAVAMIQAKRAGDARVRRAMKRIARDETRHAELSWAVARWIEPQLDADARRRVREAQEQAVAALKREAAREPDPSLTERMGMPSASQARAVLAELRTTLWSKPMAA